ncbi:MAG: PAS domain S-box protein [Dehalococcoidales bacterium]
MARFLRNPRCWLIAALSLAFVTILIAGRLGVDWIIFESDYDFLYVSVLISLYFGSIIVTAWIFGFKIGAMTSAALGALMLIRAIDNSGIGDSLLKIAAIAVAGAGTAWLIDRQGQVESLLRRRTKELGQQAVALEHELTERKQSENALKISRERYRVLFESKLEGVIVLDESMRGLLANETAAEILGFDSAAEMVDTNLLDFVLPEEREWVFGILREEMFANNVRRVHDFQLINKVGEHIWISATGALTEYQGKRAGLVSFRDITSRRRMEEVLRQSETRNRALLDAMPDMMLRIRRDGTVIDLKTAPQFPPVLSAVDLRGRKLCEVIPPDIAREARRHLRQALRSGQVESFEYRIERGREAWDLEGRFVAIGKEEITIIVRDITELRKTQEQLGHSELLASLGKMTAGIAHEVNNPLGSVLLYSEMIMTGDVPAQIRQDLKVIHDEAKRAARIVTDLLTYARRTKPQATRLDLRRVIERVLHLRRYAQKVSNVDVTVDVPDEAVTVKGDSSQLAQLFMNLVLNAEEAVRENNGGTISIVARTDRQWARVAISDDGPGIARENLNQVFYPFFTTKPIGQGTGLGLSTCYGIATDHHGLIRAENNDSGGATFIVELPLAAGRKRRQSESHETVTVA